MDPKLKKVLDALNKGGDVILPSDGPGKKLVRIPFGNLMLDIASGGGAPQGKIIRIYGPLSAGKTQNALLTFISNQTRCHYCWEDYHEKATDVCKKYKPFVLAVIDLENSWDPNWAAANGMIINPDPDEPNVLRCVPTTSEQAMDIVDTLIRTRTASIILFDSIAQAVPSIELEKSMQDYVGGKVGAHSLIMNSAMRKWQQALSQRDPVPAPLVIAINQIRETLDKYAPESTPGGKGQGFASSLDIRIQRMGYITDKGKMKGLGEKAPDKGNPVAQVTQFLIHKSKLCPSGRTGEFRIWQDNDPHTGKTPGSIAYGSALVNYATKYGCIIKTDGEYVLVSTGEALGKTKPELEANLDDNDELQARLAEDIRKAVQNA